MTDESASFLSSHLLQAEAGHLLLAEAGGAGGFVIVAIGGLVSIGAALYLLRFVRARPERDAPWGLPEFFVTFLAYLSLQFAVAGTLHSVIGRTLDEVFQDTTLSESVQNAIRGWIGTTPWIAVPSVVIANFGAVVLALLFVRSTGSGPKSLGLLPVEPARSARSAFVVGLAAWFPFLLFVNAWLLVLGATGVEVVEQTPVLALRRAAESGQLEIVFAMIVAVCIAAPIGEEVLFRGLLFRAVEKSMGIAPAALISSAAFTLIHFNIAAAGPIFVLAIGLSALYARTRNLWTCILLHAGFNAVNVITAMYG